MMGTTKDNKECREITEKHFADFPAKVDRKDLASYFAKDKMMRIIQELITSKRGIEKNYEDEFDKIDEEFAKMDL